MRTGYSGIAALVLLSAALAVSTVAVRQAVADHYSWDGGACNNSYRIYHGDSDCMHAWWNNSPKFSTGVAGGSTWGVQSFCSEWGHVKAHVDIKSFHDSHITLRDGDKHREKSGLVKINGITCCANFEICHKQQVEKDSRGYIKVYSGTGTHYNDVDVRTAEKRQHFCSRSENRGGVYCRNNLDGDALGTPENCGDHYCDVGDCRSHFEQSDAYETCQDYRGREGPTYTISATDGSSQTCTVAAYCVYSATQNPFTGAYNWARKTLVSEVRNLDEAVNCNSYTDELRLHDCGDDEEWSDLLEGTGYLD